MFSKNKKSKIIIITLTVIFTILISNAIFWLTFIIKEINERLSSNGFKIISAKISGNLLSSIKIKEVNNVLDINTVIRKISDLGYMRVLVEGGSKLSASLLNENLIDEIAWFRASKIMGNKGINAISNLDIDSIENLKKFRLISVKSIDNDQLSIYRKK